MTDITVTRHDDRSRFEAQLDGALAGHVEYQLAKDLIVLTHTEVDPAFEGRGVGSALARTVLDDVRADGTRKALIVCPFLTAWIGKHPDYADLLYGSRSD